jgi:hypothetical protein
MKNLYKKIAWSLRRINIKILDIYPEVSLFVEAVGGQSHD